MQLSNDELELLREWYGIIKDVAPDYLKAEDEALHHKIAKAIRENRKKGAV